MYMELDEWLRSTPESVLGYSLTFVLKAESGRPLKFNLHADSTRASIRIFVELYRRFQSQPEVFSYDQARSAEAKLCVRLNSSDPDANGFYNHGVGGDSTGPVHVPSRPAPAGPPMLSSQVSRNNAVQAPASGLGSSAALQMLQAGAVRGTQVRHWTDWKRFKRESTFKNWVYLVRFGGGVFAWGTASKNGSRLRKTSLFHPKLTGKYDRRVDYLMLRIIYGPPEVWVFEVEDAVGLEGRLRAQVGNRYCFGGVEEADRNAISEAFFSRFQETEHWTALQPGVQLLFRRYLSEVYFAGLHHPDDPGRSFRFGDTLEPGFIDRTLGKPELLPAIEAALRVEF